MTKLRGFTQIMLPLAQKTQGQPAAPERTANTHRYRQLTKCTPRENFFSNRIVPIWNELSPQVVQSASINGFKNRYDKSKLKSINATIARDLLFSGLATV